MLLDEIISVPYTTHPKMTKNKGNIFNKTPNLDYIRSKEKELKQFAPDLCAETFENISKQLVRKSSIYCGVPQTDSIIEFAMNFEEDVAIMHNGKLSGICFCFPSSWIPKKRIGMSLEDIHSQVADNERLIKMSAKIASTMADPVLGSFRRYVWTITNNPELSNHPKRKSMIVPKSLDDLYFRLETQTTAPIGDCVTSLFFVKVQVIPLSHVWGSYGKLITNSVNSMSDAILEYKNLKHIKTVLSSMDQNTGLRTREVGSSNLSGPANHNLKDEYYDILTTEDCLVKDSPSGVKAT